MNRYMRYVSFSISPLTKQKYNLARAISSNVQEKVNGDPRCKDRYVVFLQLLGELFERICEFIDESDVLALSRTCYYLRSTIMVSSKFLRKRNVLNLTFDKVNCSEVPYLYNLYMNSISYELKHHQYTSYLVDAILSKNVYAIRKLRKMGADSTNNFYFIEHTSRTKVTQLTPIIFAASTNSVGVFNNVMCPFDNTTTRYNNQLGMVVDYNVDSHIDENVEMYMRTIVPYCDNNTIINYLFHKIKGEQVKGKKVSGYHFFGYSQVDIMSYFLYLTIIFNKNYQRYLNVIRTEMAEDYQKILLEMIELYAKAITPSLNFRMSNVQPLKTNNRKDVAKWVYLENAHLLENDNTLHQLLSLNNHYEIYKLIVDRIIVPNYDKLFDAFFDIKEKCYCCENSRGKEDNEKILDVCKYIINKFPDYEWFSRITDVNFEDECEVYKGLLEYSLSRTKTDTIDIFYNAIFQTSTESIKSILETQTININERYENVPPIAVLITAFSSPHPDAPDIGPNGDRLQSMIHLNENGVVVGDWIDKYHGEIYSRNLDLKYDTLNFLISKGLDINAKNSFGETALMWDIMFMSNEDDHADEDYLHNNKVSKLLIDNGIDVHAISNNGNSALSIARNVGNVEMVELLTSMGVTN